MRTVFCQDALEFIDSLPRETVDLLLTDPPFFGIVSEKWDRQWASVDEFVDWLFSIFTACRRVLKPTGTLIFFGGIGRQGQRPLLKLIDQMDKVYTYQNWITWGKRRAYGKRDDYLFTREEILWYTMSEEFTFNVPHLSELRGYKGFNPKYPAKSPYKRVTNVWTDIPELFRPARRCQKPEPLIARLIETHSNPGDLVVDPFVGYGTTGIVAAKLGRYFAGCDTAPDAEETNKRIMEAYREAH